MFIMKLTELLTNRAKNYGNYSVVIVVKKCAVVTNNWVHCSFPEYSYYDDDDDIFSL